MENKKEEKKMENKKIERMVIQIAAEAEEKNYANYDWPPAAIEAAEKIAAGDTALAAKIAKASKKLPSYAKDDNGVPAPFLFWEALGL